MKKFISILFLSVFLCFAAGPASAEPILYDWWVDVDGTVYDVYPATYTAPTVGGEITNVTGFDTTGTTWGDPEAIGSVEVTFNPGAAGSYYVESFFDVEIDEWINGFDNEYGYVHGTAGSGQYGYADDGFGDDTDTDIAFWLGYDFTLAANEFAVITFNLTDIVPSGFYLEQYDPDSDESVYLFSSIAIQGGGPQPVPEPSTLLLMGGGLVVLSGLRRRLKK